MTIYGKYFWDTTLGWLHGRNIRRAAFLGGCFERLLERCHNAGLIPAIGQNKAVAEFRSGERADLRLHRRLEGSQ